MNNNSNYDIDLILPCYNPPLGWDKSVLSFYNQVQKSLSHLKINLIVVDDGSKRNFDETHLQKIKNEISDFLPVSYEENKGKGYALREAVKRSTAPYVIYTDYDFPFGTDCVKKVYEELVSGKDVVAGVRGKVYFQRLPTSRRMISIITKLLNRYILRLSVFDTQAGLKGFNKKGKEIFLSTTINSFLFDTEFILKSEKNNSVVVGKVDVVPRDGIVFSNMGFETLKNELKNFLHLASK